MDNTLKTHFQEACTVVGGTLLLVGAAVMITGWEYAPWLFSAGALFFVPAQLSDSYRGDDPIMKRLRFQQVLGAVFILVTAVLMYAGPYHARLMQEASGMNDTLRSILLSLTRKNSWIVTLAIAAVFELYSAFRMEKRQKQLDSAKN